MATLFPTSLSYGNLGHSQRGYLCQCEIVQAAASICALSRGHICPPTIQTLADPVVPPRLKSSN